jgi:trimeric autotransporter adhesin
LRRCATRYPRFAGGVGYTVTDRFRLNASFSGAPDINVYGVAVGGSLTLN